MVSSSGLETQLLRELGSTATEVVRGLPAAAAYVAKLGRESVRRASGQVTPEYSVRIIRDLESFEGLEREWNALHLRSDARSPFTFWIWGHGWWLEIGALDDRNKLWIAVVEHQNRIVGIGPYYVAANRLTGRLLRHLADTKVGSEYLDVIAELEHKSGVVAAIAAAINGEGEIDGGLLLAAPPDAALGSSAQIGWEGFHVQAMPAVDLGGSLEAFLAKLEARQDFHTSPKYVARKNKKLFKKYPRTRVLLVDQALLSPALEALFALHEKRWQSVGQSGNFPADVRAFHRRVGPKLIELGVLRLYVIELEPGEYAAALYCLRYGSRELYLQSGMNPDESDVSPGTYLLRSAMDGCARDGLREFEMLRGLEAYKAHFATHENQTVDFRFSTNSVRGLAWLAAEKARDSVRDIAKRNLHIDTVDRVRELHRRWTGRASGPVT